jgi:hypothetical protein
MTSKSLLLIGTLALAGIASAKSYDIVLSAPAKAGSVQLAAGEYSLQVKGNSVIFTNVTTGAKLTTAVKVENGTKKFQETAVDSTADKIQSIELGGSTTVLELGE